MHFLLASLVDDMKAFVVVPRLNNRLFIVIIVGRLK
jgi:hypothetical protein